MIVKAELSDKYTEMQIHVCKNQMDCEVQSVINDLNAYFGESIVVKNEAGDKESIHICDILSFEAVGPKVYARTVKGKYTVLKKLYELEEALNPKEFCRISKSEIINIKKISKVDLSISGTLRVIFKDGTDTYASRRNIRNLKNALGL